MFVKKDCRRITCYTVLLISTGLLGCFGFVSLYVFQEIFKRKLSENLVLKSGSEIYNDWVEPPVASYINFYIFNYTNVDGILNGDKPVVVQLGPYTYRNYRLNYVVNLNRDNITYMQNYSYVYEPTLSCDVCSEEDYVNTPNLAAAVVINMVKRSSVKSGIMFELAMKMLNELFAVENVKLFNPLTVRQLMWGHTDKFLEFIASFESKFSFILKLLGIQIPKINPVVTMQRNGTQEASFIGNIVVKTGSNDINQALKVIEWRNKDVAPCWKTPYGRMLNGSDGTRYKTFLERHQKLYMFMADGFRSIYVNYDRDVELYGMTLYSHGTTPDLFASAQANPDNAAFCTYKCWPSGVIHVGACTEDGQTAPVFMSWPHFYQGDPRLVEDITGLNPNREAHGLFLNVEPITGFSMQAKIRLQINLLIEKLPELNIAKNLAKNETFLPIFYFDEVGGIDQKDAEFVKKNVIDVRTYLLIGSYTGGVVGTLLFIVVLIHLLSWRRKKTIGYKKLEE